MKRVTKRSIGGFEKLKEVAKMTVLNPTNVHNKKRIEPINHFVNANKVVLDFVISERNELGFEAGVLL